jgi:hypothetical protein
MWKCQICKEENDDEFETCWSCQAKIGTTLRSVSFHAQHVSVEKSKWGVLGFYAHGEERVGDEYIIIVRNESGLPNQYGDIYFEWYDQPYGNYDVIECVELSRNGLHIRLMLEVVEEYDYNLPIDYQIRWSLTPEQFEQVRLGLKNLFRGTELLNETD